MMYLVQMYVFCHKTDIDTSDSGIVLVQCIPVCTSLPFDIPLRKQCFIQRVGDLGFPTPKLKSPPQALLTSTIYLCYFPAPRTLYSLHCHLKNHDCV